MQGLLEERKARASSSFEDQNSATHLMRHAVGNNEFGTIDHERLSKMLSLPEELARMYRDDITIIIAQFNPHVIGAQSQDGQTWDGKEYTHTHTHAYTSEYCRVTHKHICRQTGHIKIIPYLRICTWVWLHFLKIYLCKEFVHLYVAGSEKVSHKPLKNWLTKTADVTCTCKNFSLKGWFFFFFSPNVAPSSAKRQLVWNDTNSKEDKGRDSAFLIWTKFWH